jgi:nicotinamidase/pyrazinamidase
MIKLLQKHDALLIVDAQIDFFPGGVLAVPHSDKIIPVINEWLKAAAQKNILIIASRDWHPVNHCSFKTQGGIWPSHCVQDSPGAQFHPSIHWPSQVLIVNKATDPKQEAYSAFQGTVNQMESSLEQVLKEKGINRLWLAGLALDYCVVATALEARQKGFTVHVILPGTQAIGKDSGKTALLRMQAAGVIFEESARAVS